MIRWQAIFESGDLAWVSFSLLWSLALFAAGFLLIFGPRGNESRGFWKLLPVMAAFATVTWALWIYSLAFGPSAGTIPDVDPNPKPMLSLQDMMTIEDAKSDESHLYGRGGVIGGAEYLMLKDVMPVTSHNGPLFSVRRPNYHIPHILECSFRWSTFLIMLVPLWTVWFQRLTSVRMIFLSFFWSILVFAPMAHVVAGDGWLEKFGALDFSIGLMLLCIVCSSCGLTESTVGESGEAQGAGSRAAGTLMLWIGLSVHVAAHTFRADGRTTIALFNVLLGSAAGLLTWCFCSTFLWKREFTDSSTAGMLSGIAALAPGAGFMTSQSAITLGFAAGAVSNMLTHFWLRRELGSSLRFTIAATGFSSVLGVLGVGIFATSAIAGSRWDGRQITGLIEGDPSQLVAQALAIGVVSAWSKFVTFVLWRIFLPRDAVTSAS